MREHHYYVYMMMSSSRRALYTGVTNNLDRRVMEHKSGFLPGFSSDYCTHRSVWFERYSYIQRAIAREKQIKGWLRSKKVGLIESVNPHWSDLAAEHFRSAQKSKPMSS